MNAIKNLILLVDQRQNSTEIGSKATSLQHLQRLGMCIPRTYVLRWEAYQRYLQDDLSLIDEISKEIDRKLDSRVRYAVRSSANLEDSLEHSFAGQFRTSLNVQGRDALMQAIWSVWATTQTPAVRDYLSKRGLQESALQMAVILQEMVQPVISGVAFSRNPMNGLRETVIEAVRGPGTLLVQDGATPKRWIYRGRYFTFQPEDNDIPLDLIEQVARGTRSLARRLRRDIDLEWVYDGRQLYWLQMRDITTLAEVPVYSSRISREMLAGIIKPLIWSVNIPLVNGAWVRMLTELIGPNQLDPHILAKSFYYRSYFNMGLLGEVFEQLGFPAESLEMAWGIAPKGTAKFHFRPGLKALRLLPRLVQFSWDKWTMTQRVERQLNALEAQYRAIDVNAIKDLPSEALLDGIDRLFVITQDTAYYNIILPMLMFAYNAVLRSQLKQCGFDYALIDMQQDSPDFQRFNPGYHLDRLNQKFKELSPHQQEEIRNSTYMEVLSSPNLDGFRDGFADLLLKFGHLSDNGNDFSTSPWRENGDAILRLAIEDRSKSAEHTEPPVVKKINMSTIRLPFWKGWMLRRLHRRTRRYNLYREHISYVYTYGYGLFRSYFLALGCCLAKNNLLDNPTDVFYLEWGQIREAVHTHPAPETLRAIVEGHKQGIERVRNAQLPQVIYGDTCPPVEVISSHRLVGVPTSRGYCTGPVKVVTGLQDFDKVQPGDILVIPYSDVGWTPLFAHVVGVISESGGMLSHSSIIAREYGIPAVVSVPGATLLKDGAMASMDGYKGEVIILTGDENETIHSQIEQV